MRIISPSQLRALRENSARQAAQARARKLAVLRHLCNGIIPKKIAHLENVPLTRVRRYLQELQDMSNARTREQLGIWAVREGHVKL